VSLEQFPWCSKENSAGGRLSHTLVFSPRKSSGGSIMMLERDYAAERLARVTVLFDEANRTKAQMLPTDRTVARQLVVRLDQMLRELGQPDFRRKS
jgi:hypothetical protein